MKLSVQPLDDATWPGTLRTDGQRKPSPFSASWHPTMKLLGDEVDLTANGGKFHTPTVLEVPFDRGQLYIDGAGVRADARNPRHPGVAISFDIDGTPFRLAIDQYRNSGYSGYLPDWQSNVRAIASTLRALRAVDRYGGTTTNQQYRGWQALGSGTPMGAGAMSVDEAAELLGLESGIGSERLLGGGSWLLAKAYRMAAQLHHPDVGGDPEMFRRLTDARDLLLGGDS